MSSSPTMTENSEFKGKHAAVRPGLSDTQKQDLALMGSPPLVWGEDRDAYDQLLASVLHDVNPDGIVELIYVRNFVDLEWEIIRLRRAKSNIVNAGKERAAVPLLDPYQGLHPASEYFDLLDGVGKDDFSARLEKAGLTPDDVVAQAISNNARTLEHIDLMIMRMEERRNSSLREAFRYRQNLGQRLARAKAPVEDVEFRVIDGEDAEIKRAA